MAEHIFTGFGFGPIQGGLFVKEAFQSGNFARIVVSEIDAELVGAVRANNGSQPRSTAYQICPERQKTSHDLHSGQMKAKGGSAFLLVFIPHQECGAGMTNKD